MSAADLTAALLTPAGPHPDGAALRQYAAGTLAPAAEQRIEAHTLDCERCADIVAGFAMSDDAATDRAVTALRQRLRARVAAAPPVEVTTTRFRWPQLAAAAALVGGLAAGVWGWERYAPATAPAGPGAEAVATTTTPPAPLEPAAPAETAPPVAAPATVAAPPADQPQLAAATRTARPNPALLAQSGRQRAADRRIPPPAAPTSAAVVAASPPPADYAAPETPTAEVAMNSPAAPSGTLDNSTDKSTSRDEAATQDDLKEATSSGAAIAAATPRAIRAPSKLAKTKVAADQAAAPVETGRAAEPMPPGPALAPAPAGGLLALREYLRREAAKFEPAAELNHLTGNIRVRFTVGEDGKIRNAKVLRGLRADYDAEALRLLTEGPRWIPGIAGGQRAALPVELTVPF